eukprot:910204-Prymnesium_polylepis.1
METYGWVFDWMTIMCSDRVASSAATSRRLPTTASNTLATGTVVVKLIGAELASADKELISNDVTSAFSNSDVLTVADGDGVVVINSLTFNC